MEELSNIKRRVDDDNNLEERDRFGMDFLPAGHEEDECDDN